MGIRGIIREELKKLIEADYYDNFPDFFDPLYNPQVGAYPPVGSHSYGHGTLVREDDESGGPLVIDIMKNMEPAEHFGSRFGQDVEAHGTYVTEGGKSDIIGDMYTTGKANIKNPLYIDLDEYENIIDYKRDLSKKYKSKNKALTKKLMSMGYDAIVTRTKRYGTGEIVLFPNADFYLEPINNKEVNEGVLEEDYPSSWDVEEFKKLSSFNARIKYCEEHLQRISSGSARIAYKIDDQKVLKLAKNKKGLAQNDVEITQSGYGDTDGVVAQVFEYDEDNLWLEMELARKVKKSDFKRITGFNFDDYAAAINNVGVEHSRRGYKMQIDGDLFQEMWEDEFTSEMFDYIVGYEVPTGDLMRLSTYGVVKRDWGDSIVIIDFGLDKDVHSSHYS